MIIVVAQGDRPSVSVTVVCQDNDTQANVAVLVGQLLEELGYSIVDFLTEGDT